MHFKWGRSKGPYASFDDFKLGIDFSMACFGDVCEVVTFGA